MSVECWLRADRADGNDPVEATVRLPIVPREDDLIEVWNAQGGGRHVSGRVSCPVCQAAPGQPCIGGGASSAGIHSLRTEPSGEPGWLEVDRVVLHPERDGDGGVVEVWVRLDAGYDLALLERLMDAAQKGERP